MSPAARVAAFGDRAVLVELEQRIDARVAARAAAIADRWEALGHGPAVPAYASAVLRFDPLRLSSGQALALARDVAAEAGDAPPLASGRLVEIPTRYDGPDLASTAERSGLTTAELIRLHAGGEYRCFFVGFMPGFAYLGGLDTRIRASRLDSPRPHVPAGSVAVIDGQTAVYPLESPGGWRLIGRTDLAPFDPRADPPALLRPGDLVRFRPVD